MKPVLKHGKRPFDMTGEGLFAVIGDKSNDKAKLYDSYDEAWRHATRQGFSPQSVYIRLSIIQMSAHTHQEIDTRKSGEPIDSEET